MRSAILRVSTFFQTTREVHQFARHKSRVPIAQKLVDHTDSVVATFDWVPKKAWSLWVLRLWARTARAAMASDSMVRMRARSRSVDCVAPVPKTPLRNPDEPIETSSLRANGSVEGLQLIGQELVAQRTIQSQGHQLGSTQVGRTPPQHTQLNSSPGASQELVDASGALHQRSECVQFWVVNWASNSSVDGL